MEPHRLECQSMERRHFHLFWLLCHDRDLWIENRFLKMAWTTMDNTNLLLDIILIAMALRLSLRSCLVVMATFAVCCGDECSAVSESRSIAFMKCSGTTEDLTDRSPQEVIHQLQRTVQTQKAETNGLRKQLIDSGELREDDGEAQSNQASSRSDWSSRRRRRASPSFSNRRCATTSCISRRRSRVHVSKECND